MTAPPTSRTRRGTTLKRRSWPKSRWSPIKRTSINRAKKPNPRRVANERKFKALRRASWRTTKNVWPTASPEYLEWLRMQPCVVSRARGTKQTGKTEPAHVGLRGSSQKCSDFEAIPLSPEFHRRGYPESHHTLGKGFWSYHGLDRNRLIEEHVMRWRLEVELVTDAERGRSPEGA